MSGNIKKTKGEVREILGVLGSVLCINWNIFITVNNAKYGYALIAEYYSKNIMAMKY